MTALTTFAMTFPFLVAAAGVLVGWLLRAILQRPDPLHGDEHSDRRESPAQWREAATGLAGDVDDQESRLEELYGALVTRSRLGAERAAAIVAEALEVNTRMRRRLLDAGQQFREQGECRAQIGPAVLNRPERNRMAPQPAARDTKGGDLVGPCVRNTFCLALGHRLAESKRRGDPISVIMVRIDNYRSLCASYGHSTGNHVLDAAGKFFIAAVRGMDWVARFDATTFAFLLPNTELANATRVAERLRTTASSHALTVDGNCIHVTISTGTAQASDGDSGDVLLCRAEKAMQASTEAGGNCSHSCTEQEVRPIQAVTDAPVLAAQ
jgi:diguanylate cyclase (GGDEF)-like protein